MAGRPLATTSLRLVVASRAAVGRNADQDFAKPWAPRSAAYDRWGRRMDFDLALHARCRIRIPLALDSFRLRTYTPLAGRSGDGACWTFPNSLGGEPADKRSEINLPGREQTDLAWSFLTRRATALDRAEIGQISR